MWIWADRMIRTVSDVTVGTVIVLVHVVLADRVRRALQLTEPLAGGPPGDAHPQLARRGPRGRAAASAAEII